MERTRSCEDSGPFHSSEQRLPGIAPACLPHTVKVLGGRHILLSQCALGLLHLAQLQDLHIVTRNLVHSFSRENFIIDILI